MGTSNLLSFKIKNKGEFEMKTNCNVIRDLLPLYIDKISSEETNKLIEEHFEECEECKKYYEIM